MSVDYSKLSDHQVVELKKYYGEMAGNFGPYCHTGKMVAEVAKKFAREDMRRQVANLRLVYQ